MKRLRIAEKVCELTNFFSNSKPFHFISINLLLFVGYTLYNFQISNFDNGIIELILSTFKFSLYIALMLIFGFIIKKNKLTQTNSYALFSFSCFLLMVPILFQDSKPVFSLLFLLLALRRILSFNSKKNIQKKILDASLWIGIATLFYFWSLLFFFVLYAALIQLAELKQHIKRKRTIGSKNKKVLQYQSIKKRLIFFFEYFFWN